MEINAKVDVKYDGVIPQRNIRGHKMTAVCLNSIQKCLNCEKLTSYVMLTKNL